MRYTGPKARRVRRQGMNLYGSDKYDKILQRKPHTAGKEKGARVNNKLSEYGKQLLEKQKICAIYGLTNKQLLSLFRESSRAVGQTNTMLQTLLERRLDSVIYRAGFALTRIQARQFASHGMFTVNGQRVTIASYRVRAGDTITVRTQKRTSPVFPPIFEAHQKYVPPSWLKANPSTMTIEVAALPSEEKHFEQGVDIRKVIAFYSR